MQRSRPVFILGNPRSGTTLLRLILTSHQNITIPPETDFIIKHYKKYIIQKYLTVNDIKELVALMQRKGDVSEHWRLNFEELPDYLQGEKNITYAKFCEYVYKYYSEKNGFGLPVIWGDKNNAYMNYIDVLSNIFPEAFFINITRDGRAVLSSYKELKSDPNTYSPKLPKDAEIISARWSSAINRLDEHLKRYAPGRHITIKYEDLMLNYESTINQICTRLSIKADDAMRDFYMLNRKKNLEPIENKGWKEMTWMPMDKKRIDRWKTKLNKRDLYVFEFYCKKELNKYEYDVVSDTENNLPFQFEIIKSFPKYMHVLLIEYFKEKLRGIRCSLIFTIRNIAAK
jgi:Sulfotransferase family